jgi:hypothetical protein
MFEFINSLVNYGGVLLLGVVSLMAGSTTGVLISPGYGGHEQQHTQQPVTTLRPPSSTPPRLQSITPQFMLVRAIGRSSEVFFFLFFAPPEYYTTQAPPEYYTTQAPPEYYTTQALAW